MLAELLGVANVLGAGLLAGEEFVICYGVRRPLANLEPQPSIWFRQALIRRLRVVVPAVFAFAFLTGLGAAIAGGPALLVRCAGLALLALFISVTLVGTVPINQAALAWTPASPPDDWRLTVGRWERLDTVRTWAAMSAFAMFVLALVVR